MADFDPSTAQPIGFDPSTAAPVREVGFIETALRTAAGAAQQAVRTVDMARAGLTQVLADPVVSAGVRALPGGAVVAGIDKLIRGDKTTEQAQEEIFRSAGERQQGMTEAYAQKPDEEFGLAGKLGGAAVGLPISMVSGLAGPGISRAMDVIERGGTMGEAAKAGLTSAAVGGVMMALPAAAGLKVAQASGAAGAGALRSVLAGGATGAAINVPAGAAGRAIENAALPEGEQYKDLKRDALDPEALATDALMAAGFGAMGGKHAHSQGKAAAAKAKASAPPPFPADKMKDAGDGDYTAPNGATVTKEQWENSSTRVREGWMKEKPPEEKIPVGEVKELTAEEAAAKTLDTSALDKAIERGGPVAEVAKKVKAKKVKEAEAAAAEAKKRTDAADLRREAAGAEDADLKAELLKEADKLDPPGKIPVGEVKEGQPEIAVKDEKVPVGKVIEGQPDIPVAGEKIPVGEVTAEYPAGGTPVVREAPPEAVPVGEARELYADPNREGGLIPKGEATEVEMLPVGEVKEGQPDIPVKAEKIPVGEAAEMIPTGEATELKKIPVGKTKELSDGTREVPKQEGVRQERVQGDEVGPPETPGTGDRVQRAAEGGRQAEGTPKEVGNKSLDLGLPKIDETFMREQERVAPRGAEARAALPDERGRRHVRDALERGAADGTLNKDGVALATWALDKNPNLAAGLKLRTSGEPPVPGARGSYDDAHRVVELFKGNDEPHTAAHEILHHSERMMPQKVQDGVRREWRRHIQSLIGKTKDPVTKAALADIPRAMRGDVQARDRVRAAVRANKLDYKLYDPSEFWAVNAARILNERHGSRNAWHTQARQWLREMVEHVKGTIGMRSDAPVLRALDEVLNPKKTTGVERTPAQIKGGEGSLSLATGPAKRALPEETRGDVVERKLFDRFNRVAKLQTEQAPKGESADIYKADVLYPGRTQHRGDKLEKDFINPLGAALEKAKKAGITVRDADDYLMARHASERNALIASRNPKMQDGGSGFTNKQAQDIIDSFTPEQRKHLDDVSKIVRDLNRTKLDGMVDDGLISAATRDFLDKQFKHYVPLKTLDAEDEVLGTGRGYAMRANDIVTALGRSSKAGSPIAASVMDASRALIRGEKARVERTIWEYADKDAKDFIRPYDPDHPPAEVMDRKIGPDGKVKETVSSQKVQDLTIPLVVNGENVRVFVPDQLLRDQLLKVTQVDPGALKYIGKATGTIGRLLTEFNPAFTIPNAVKDAITVAVRAGSHDGVSTARVMANIPRAWKTIVEHKAGANTPGAKMYEEFLTSGGKTGAYGIQSVADTMSKLEKAGAALGYDEHSAGYARRLGRVLAKIPRAVSGMNEVLEYASRFALYKEMREQGATPAKAASTAKEVTVNFNRSGEWGRTLNSVLVFTNAALQGLRNTGVYLKSPHVRKGVMGLVAMGAAAQAWNEQMGGENEETAEPNINSQNDAVADKNLVMLMPNSRKGLKIPLPPEYAFAFTIGRRMYRAASQGDIAKEAGGIVGAVLDAVLPVRLPDADSGALAVGKALAPTVVSPVSDVWLNQSFFGTPIVPEQRNKHAPQPYFTMSRATTSDLAKSVSEIANSVTGGDRVTPGWSQKALGPLISPEGIDHITRGYTGGVGAIAMQTKNVVRDAAEGKPVDTNKLPIANRFVFDEPQSYTSRRYKELADDYEYAQRYAKLGESEKISPKIQATLEQYMVAEKTLTALFKELRDAGASGEDREPIQQRIKAAQSDLIKAYNQAK